MNINNIGVLGIENDNFYKMDGRDYILEENVDFMQWYNMKINKGYEPILPLESLQNMMWEIVSFFEFKYHQKLISDMFRDIKEEHYCESLDIARKLNIEELKYRLHNDYIAFLGCGYERFFQLRKKKENFWDISSITIYPEENGEIPEKYLEELVEYEYLDNVDGIKTLSDLLGRFLAVPTKVDYSDLERVIFNHKTNLEFRTKVLQLTALAILYSRNSLPTVSYIRVKNFMRMFNREYNLNLNMDGINEIISLDYKTEISDENKQKLVRVKRKIFE